MMHVLKYNKNIFKKWILFFIICDILMDVQAKLMRIKLMNNMSHNAVSEPNANQEGLSLSITNI